VETDDDLVASPSAVEFCQHRVEELQHCTPLPAPRHAAHPHASPRCPVASRCHPPFRPCTAQSNAWHPQQARQRASCQDAQGAGGCRRDALGCTRMQEDPGRCRRMPSYLQGTGVKPRAHQRGCAGATQANSGLGTTHSPPGYSLPKITHHRLHTAFWLRSPLLLGDSSVFSGWKA